MRSFSSLARRLEALEEQLAAGSFVLTTLSGRRLRLTREDRMRLFGESMMASHKCFDLVPEELAHFEISDKLAALADSQPNGDWPNDLESAHSLLTKCGKYVGLKQVMQYLRTPPEPRFLMKEHR